MNEGNWSPFPSNKFSTLIIKCGDEKWSISKRCWKHKKIQTQIETGINRQKRCPYSFRGKRIVQTTEHFLFTVLMRKDRYPFTWRNGELSVDFELHWVSWKTTSSLILHYCCYSGPTKHEGDKLGKNIGKLNLWKGNKTE